MDHNKVWKILKEMGIPDHLTCLLRNAGLEETQSGIKIAGRNINNLRWSKEKKKKKMWMCLVMKEKSKAVNSNIT